MKAKLNFGIIGLGWPGQQHAIAARAIDNVRLYASADTDEARRADFENEFAPDKTYRGYEELLQDDEVHAVVICLPNFLHFPASLAALGAGNHVLCEKPPTLNAAEMKVLREEAA